MSSRAQRYQARQQAQMSGSTAQPAQPVIVRKSRSQWGVVGLDLGNSAFSKCHAAEQKLETGKKQYDLSRDTFEAFRRNLYHKVTRMHALQTFTIADADGTNRNLLKEYVQLQEPEVVAARNHRWPATGPTFATQEAADRFNDHQIKASVLGEYLINSLTDSARHQIMTDKSLFVVTDYLDGSKYFDGVALFHVMARVVDPNNDHLIEIVRKKLRNLHIKEFGFSAIKMLAEFKYLKERIVNELGGTYSTDDQFLDLWSCLKTMHEQEFKRYVKQLQDERRDATSATKKSIDAIIKLINGKQIAMQTDNEWNVMSHQDAMIAALMSKVQQDSNSKKDKNKNKNKSKEKNQNNDKSKDKDKDKKEYKYPTWKTEAPKNGAATSKEVDGRTWHWCTKCRNGEGLWALHKTEDHNDNYVRPSKAKKDDKSKDDSKNVTFTANTKESDGKEKGPAIKVSKDLMNSTKSYLAKFSDFREAGAQGN
jgi:hypothetical protein